MRRPQHAGRRISILLLAALVGLGAVAGGVALAETAPRDPGGGGRVIEPGTSIPGAELPGGGGGTPVGPPVITGPPPTITPPTIPVGGGGGGGFGGGGTGAPPSDLSVTKTAPSTVEAGAQLSYDISVTKLPSDNAENVVLTDVLPAGTTFEAIASPEGWSCVTPAVGSNGTVTCSIASLAPTPSAAFGIAVRPDNSTPGGTVITNTATVRSTPADANLANNSSSASTTVANPPPLAADLSVTKSDGPDPVTAGNNIVYTITAANAGPASAASVSLTDAVPANTTFFSLSAPAGWTTTTPAVGGTGNVTATTNSLANGASATFALVVHVNPNTANGTTITNSAAVASSTSDPNAANNTATATTTVAVEADLAVTKSDSPDPVTAGTNLTYTIAVTNNGPSDAQNVSLADSLVPGTTFVSFTAPAGWTSTTPAVGGSGSVTATNPLVANGASASFTLVVKVDSNVADGAILSNTVTGSTVTSDPSPANNTATATTTVTTAADVSVSKMAPATATDGTNITYAIPVTNNGPSNAPNVSMTDAVPANTTFVSATPSAGSCSGTTTVTCNVGTVAPGATVNISLVVKLGATTAGGTIITNTASASSPATDPNSANNSATANTTAVAALQSITVTPANKTLAPGMSQQYTATGNYSDASTQDLTATANWSSSAAGVASVNASGLVHASARGTTNIGASVGAISGGQSLTVSRLLLVDIRPLFNVMRPGATQGYQARGHFLSGTVADITPQVTWISTNSKAAVVNAQGVVTAKATGATAVFGRFGNSLALPALLLVV
jgi:uncharacterized repeat protein (TIGR01451 family)